MGVPEWLLGGKGLRVFSGRHQPRIYQSREQWDWYAVFSDYDLWFCLDGRGEMVVDGEPHAIEPGTVFLFCPGQVVHGRSLPGNPLRNFAVHFLLEPGLTLEFRAGRVGRNLPLLRLTAEWCTELVDAPGVPRAALRTHLVTDFLLRLLIEMERGEEPALERRLREQVRAVEAEPWRDWSVEALARAVGLSLPQLNRRWRHFTGTSPRRFVIQARCATARRLLEESTLTVQEIADSLGYRDVFFFSRQFKRETGSAPRAYRENKRVKPRRSGEPNT